MDIFPGKNEQVITSTIIGFLVGAILILTVKIDNKILEILLTGITTLAAAFFGAKYAFILQNKWRKNEETKRNVESVNKTIYHIITHYNKLVNYRDQFINEFKDSEIRHLAILPALGMGSYKEIDLDSLSFILKTKYRNILLELSLYQSEAYATFEVILERSNYHSSRIQEALEKADLDLNQGATIQQLNKALGPLKYTTIIKYTDQMIQSTDSLIKSSEVMIEKLNKISKEMFKGHAIISMKKLSEE